MKECTNENQTIHSAISMSLMSVMEETHAESGEVLLMDVHSDSCIQYAGFKKRTMGGFVEIDSFLPPAAPVILLPAIYLIIMEHGGLPTDIISTGTEKFSLREILSTASEKKINKSISQYVLNGAQGLNYYLTQMGAWWHTSDRYSYQEFKLIQLKPFQMLSWMNVIARGESFIQSYPEDVVDKKIIIHSKNYYKSSNAFLMSKKLN